jgi:hypothetical protein
MVIIYLFLNKVPSTFVVCLRYGMTIEQVREYERETFERTNKKVLQTPLPATTINPSFD